MPSFACPPNISFRVETMFADNGKNGRVGRLKCDENGVYKGLPMMPLGEVSQQQTYYDPKSIMDQITNPESRFHKILKQNKVYGEYGHPTFYGMNNSDQLSRLTAIDEKSVSHLFTGFYTDKPSADGTVILRADLKPYGPFGKVFKEGLDDPMVNTAFSLRAFVNTDMRGGIKYRTVKSLTTFDTVGPSGFARTDKANALGLESFAGDQFHDYEIHVMENGNLLIDQIALESIANTDLNEILGTNDIAKVIQSRTIVQVDPSAAERFPNLYKNGIFNDYFKD